MSTQQNQGAERVTISAADVGTLKVNPHAPHLKSKVVHDKEAFCDRCQAKTIHKMSRIKDGNGHHELVFTCDCGDAFKMPLFHKAHCSKCVDEHGNPLMKKHTVEVKDGAGTATCECGEVVKMRPVDIDEHLEAHHKANAGKVTVEMAAADEAEWDKVFMKRAGIKVDG